MGMWLCGCYGGTATGTQEDWTCQNEGGGWGKKENGREIATEQGQKGGQREVEAVWGSRGQQLVKGKRVQRGERGGGG